MIVAVLANNFLPALGVYFIVVCAIKITLRYPVKRWFF